MNNISFEDFLKLDIRVATILKAERIEGSEKLLRLEIDIGGEERQLVAGIGKTHKPEALIGKQIPVLANLEPKKLMGIESQGMILAADDNGSPMLLLPERTLNAGSKIK